MGSSNHQNYRGDQEQLIHRYMHKNLDRYFIPLHLGQMLVRICVANCSKTIRPMDHTFGSVCLGNSVNIYVVAMETKTQNTINSEVLH